MEKFSGTFECKKHTSKTSHQEMSKFPSSSTKFILSNKHKDSWREAEPPPDERTSIIFDYEELDKMAVELKLARSELEAKNKILEENEAAMKMMEHETDKLKEMQLSDAMEKESLRDALQTMKDRMERLEKEKGMAEEARHMARPLEEQLVGLLKRNKKLEKLLERVKFDYIELLVDEKSKILSRIQHSSTKRERNNSTSVLPGQETQYFASEINNSPNKTQQGMQESELSGSRLDVEKCMKEIERLRLQRKLELHELMKLRESAFSRFSASSLGTIHDQTSLTAEELGCFRMRSIN